MDKDLKEEMLRLGRMYDEQTRYLWDAVYELQIENNVLRKEILKLK